uniref:Superoxide dismutase copper/zinc binding domain-containing protein n=1 Tax=Kryptolebias marmoratus TaxID=37003 RepID=A0A3Q3BMQ3_KRYMA
MQTLFHKSFQYCQFHITFHLVCFLLYFSDSISNAHVTTSHNFLLLKLGSTYKCAQIYDVPRKVVGAVLNMRGIKGYFRFQQASPFDLTQIDVNLTNLENKVGPYHVHLFPVSSLRPNPCSNDNVGGHWNPFELNTNDPSYPNGPGTAYADTFTDFNLPLFGQNSIVGRSVVIHLLDGARYTSASGQINCLVT